MPKLISVPRTTFFLALTLALQGCLSVSMTPPRTYPPAPLPTFDPMHQAALPDRGLAVFIDDRREAHPVYVAHRKGITVATKDPELGWQTREFDLHPEGSHVCLKTASFFMPEGAKNPVLVGVSIHWVDDTTAVVVGFGLTGFEKFRFELPGVTGRARLIPSDDRRVLLVHFKSMKTPRIFRITHDSAEGYAVADLSERFVSFGKCELRVLHPKNGPAYLLGIDWKLAHWCTLEGEIRQGSEKYNVYSNGFGLTRRVEGQLHRAAFWGPTSGSLFDSESRKYKSITYAFEHDDRGISLEKHGIERGKFIDTVFDVSARVHAESNDYLVGATYGLRSPMHPRDPQIVAPTVWVSIFSDVPEGDPRLHKFTFTHDGGTNARQTDGCAIGHRDGILRAAVLFGTTLWIEDVKISPPAPEKTD